MSNDPDSGDGVPDPVREWLAGLANAQDSADDELVARLLSTDGEGFLGAEAVADLEDRIREIETTIDSLDGDVDELIRDVRERVIQVKREADAKAPHDHDHPVLSENLGRLGAHVEAIANDFVDLDASTDDLAERLDAVDDRLALGFSNFEEVLSYLIETTDDAHEKLEAVAAAAIDLRRRTERLAKAEARRSAADRLRETAGEHGITEAKCENCGATVDLRLLAAPDCLHCDARFVELEPRRGFFRSSLLHTGERPALEGEVAGESSELASILADEGSTPPSTIADRGTDRMEAAGSTADDPGTDEGDDQPAEDEEDAGAASPSGDAADANVETVSGIGPAYAARLRAAGVESVGDLALSDPIELAEETDIEPGRIENLVRRARETADPE